MPALRRFCHRALSLESQGLSRMLRRRTRPMAPPVKSKLSFLPRALQPHDPRWRLRASSGSSSRRPNSYRPLNRPRPVNNNRITRPTPRTQDLHRQSMILSMANRTMIFSLRRHSLIGSVKAPSFSLQISSITCPLTSLLLELQLLFLIFSEHYWPFLLQLSHIFLLLNKHLNSHNHSLPFSLLNPFSASLYLLGRVSVV